MNMQRFWWPGYQMQLLGELQKQQNCAQFCDTLLQTEGISVPTHSCVLAALSPYLSQKLSTCPPPPPGQKRRLQLQTVTAQTLLKLVGLLYSGELEVRGTKEQNEVLSAAHQFGIVDLILGCKNRGLTGGELLNGRQMVEKETTERHRNLEVPESEENAPLAEKKSFISTGTQMVEVIGSDQPAPQCPSPAATFPTCRQPQSPASDEQSNLTSHPTTHSGVESAVGEPNGGVTNPTSFPTSQEENVVQQSGDGLIWDSDEKANSKTTEDDGGNVEQSKQASGDVTVPGEKEMRRSVLRAAGKSLEKMKEMGNAMETTQVSVKVKLRKRTKGRAWEVVNLQDKEAAASALTCMTQMGGGAAGSGGKPRPPSLSDTLQLLLEDLNTAHVCLLLRLRSLQKTPQKDQTDVQNPETPNLRSVLTTPPKPPNPVDTSSDSEPRSGVTLNQSSQLELEALPPPQGSVEDSEELDRMLDEIMMGLNILPNLDIDCKKTQLSQDGVQNFSQVPFLDGGAGATANTAGCVFYQDLGTQSGHLPAATGIQSRFGVQNQPSVTGLSADSPTQQRRPEFSSSIRSSGQSDGTLGHRNETSLYLQTPGSKLKPLYPGSLQPSGPKGSSLSHGNEMPFAHTFSFPRIGEFRLPQPVSPIQQQPSKSLNPVQLHRRPWLTETPWSLQFPLSTFTENKSRSSPQDTNTSCGSEKLRPCMGWKPKNWGTCAKSGTMRGHEERGAKSPSGEKSDHKKRRKRKQVAAGDAATPTKRDCKEFLLDSAGQYLASKNLKVKNMLEERRMTVGPSNRPHLLLEKPKETSTVTASADEKTRMVGNFSAEQTRIRTRGFMKRSQEKRSNKLSEKRVLIPVLCRTVVDDKQSIVLSKRKRGRPRKINQSETSSHSVPTKTENRSHDGVDEQQRRKDLPKEEETKRRGRNLRRNEASADDQKTARRVESSAKTPDDIDTKNLKTHKQSWIVTLKEFQKLISHQRSKTRKSAQSQRAEESGGEGTRRDALTGSGKEAETKIEGSAKILDQGFTDAPVDENQNQLCSTSAAQRNESRDDGTNGSTGQKSCFQHDDNPTSSDVPEQEVSKWSHESERVQKEDAFKPVFPSEGSDAVQLLVSDEGPSRSDVPPPEETSKALVPDFHLQKTGATFSAADGINMTSGCDGEEEEEDEEEEVDILLYSPDKGPPTQVCEDGLSNMAVDDDDEEEEDVNDIDVTGDEAE